MPKSLSLSCLLVLALPISLLGDATINFNRDIRPILSENCFACHGQDGNNREADLRLDQQEAAIDSGAIEPGDASASELIARINTDDADLVMPPPDSNRSLSIAQKRLLEEWVDDGAEFEDHWSFIAPSRPDQPDVENTDWIRNPIDRFVLAKLEASNLAPSPEADRATLIKRLFIDLAGLPPSPEEVDAFVDDKDEQAYEKLVDRILESKHYGERMALPWLDAARYADSNGFQQDGDTWQWIWRDWLVRALNDDLPFDQLTIWQLAGDLLPNATVDQKIASGFNRNHLLNGEGGAIAEEQRWVNLFDRIDTTSTTWLGLTMACAQCHDHKYDPITQRDYYSMLDAFNRVPERGTPKRFSTRIRVDTPFLELPTEENKQRIAALEAKIEASTRIAETARQAAFQGWKLGLLANSSAATLKKLPDAAVEILNKAGDERSKDEELQLDEALQPHFDKLAKSLVENLPPTKELEKARDDLGAYKKGSNPSGDDHERREATRDQHPVARRILEAGGKSLLRDAGVSAAHARRRSCKSAGLRTMAGLCPASAHGARAGQSNVAIFFWHGNREDLGRFRCTERIPKTQRVARLVGG